MFHYTERDMFCNDVKCFADADADGYVPEAEDICQNFSYPDEQFRNLSTWSEHIQNSVQATRTAQQKLMAWKNRLS